MTKLQRMVVQGLMMASLITPASRVYATKTQQAGFVDLGQELGVDPTGLEDSTLGIQAAIDKASSASKTLYIPPGTYLVSDTLLGTHRSGNDCGGHDGIGRVVLIGTSAHGMRPLLRLKDDAAGFQDSSNPKPVVRVRFITPAGEERPNCAFRDGIRGIDIDLGNNNTGAVGIHFDAAQDSFLVHPGA